MAQLVTINLAQLVTIKMAIFEIFGFNVLKFHTYF